MVRQGLMGLILSAMGGVAGAEGTLAPQPVAWFTDNGDRAPLQDLRNRPEASLSVLERAILEASNRIGWIEIPDCGRGSNAVLIRVDGRDAVLTSRHLIAGKWMGEWFCAADARAVYYPNYAYVQPDGGGDLTRGDLLASVPLEPGPVNADSTGLVMVPPEDWLVYFLTETISDQPPPPGAFNDGEPRGAVAFATNTPRRGEVVVVGIDGRYSARFGKQFSWQACRYLLGPALGDDPMYIDCDVSPGASSSLLGVLEGASLTVRGLVTGQMDSFSGTDVPVPAAPILWNLATPVEGVVQGLSARN